MSEFSSGTFEQFRRQNQFPPVPNDHENKTKGVQASEAEVDSPQNVKWEEIQDTNRNRQREGEKVTSNSDHGVTFPATPLVTLASSATFDLFNEHVTVDDMFPRDEAGFEPSASNLQNTSDSRPTQSADELCGSYDGMRSRWQATVSSPSINPNDSSGNKSVVDVLQLVIPGSSEETMTISLNYNLVPSSSNNFPFTSTLAAAAPAFSYRKANQSSSGLQLSSSSPSGIINNVSSPSATSSPLDLDYEATQIDLLQQPFVITSESDSTFDMRNSRLQEQGETSASTIRNMTSGVSSQQNMAMQGTYYHAQKVVKARSDLSLEKRQVLNSRVMTDQLDHVLRERQRRDDMSAKIATLETLLPPAPKRDRVSIVHDGIQYVKTMQQKVKVLQEQLREAKLKFGAKVHQNKKARLSLTIDGSGSSKRMIKYGSSSGNPSSFTKGTGSSNLTGLTLGIGNERRVELEGSGLDSATMQSVTKKLEQNAQNRCPISVELHVQVDRPGEQVQVFKCDCRYNYLSSIMRTLDQLQLSLRRCSVTKLHDYVLCVIVVQSTAHSVSSSQIATLLQIAVTADYY